MLIRSVEANFYEFTLPRPVADARSTIRARSCVLVRVTTDSGHTGWGEAASFAGCGALVTQVVRFYGERLAGRGASDPAALYDEMFGASLHFGRRGLAVNALSGIDTALWDIKARAEKVPLAGLLGRRRSAARVYFNGGYYVDEDPHGFVRASAESALARGAAALKIKIGRSVEDDARRLTAARRVLGPGPDLMADVNGVADIDYLRALDPVLRDHDVRWIEEPAALGRLKDLLAARAVLTVPVAGYELEQTSAAWADLIESGAVDIAQPDAIWSGGVTECARTFAPADAAGVEWVPHNFASIVCLAANAHLACAAPTGGWLEADSNENPFLWDLDSAGAFRLENGAVALPDAPGLGVVPDTDRIESLRVSV